MRQRRHGKVLVFDFVINTLLTVIEYAAGIASGSAAILADGSQNLTDSLVITIAFICERVALRPGTSKRKAAAIFRRAGALNASILMVLAVCIGALAINRMLHPQVLNSALVVGVGVLSIGINFWAAGLLFANRRDTSITAPYVGLLFSGLSGIGVFTSGIIAHFWQLYRVDGIVGLIIAALLLLRSTKMLFVALWKPQKRLH